MAFLRAEVVTRAWSPERFAELAAAWFTETREELFGELDRGLKAGPSLAFDHRKNPNGPMGPPGGAYGTLWVQRQPALIGGSQARYSDRAWRRMLGGLAEAYPYHAELTAEPLDDQGLPAQRTQHVIIGVHRAYTDPEWVMLRIRASFFEQNAYPHVTDAPFPAGVPRRWAEFIKNWVTRADAVYAYVTDDPEVLGGTALEDATGRDAQATVPRSGEVLRGYSWVTVCSPVLASRLGGTPALAASGVFDEVTGLPGGQVFLRATPDIEDYRGEALRRVFETLAPVLLTGRPNPGSSATRRGRLVTGVDAAAYQ